MSRKTTSKRTPPKPKAVLRLPDLDQAKSALAPIRTSATLTENDYPCKSSARSRHKDGTPTTRSCDLPGGAMRPGRQP
jgi:hypothetical protein